VIIKNITRNNTVNLENSFYHTDDLSNHSFLVTGGAGFIGSNLTEYLLKNGAGKVRVLDNFLTGTKHNIKDFFDYTSFELIEGDIRDLDTCKKACTDIEYVMHQAALGSVPRSIKDPINTNSININGFLNVITACKESRIKRFIYAASSSTYGDSTALPKTEDAIGKPLSPYAVSKYVNELYANVFANLYGLDVIGLRYFNVYGPNQSPEGAYAAVIPLFIDAVMNDIQPVIYGDGSQTRDFTFVQDAIQANIKAAFVQNSEAINSIYNIAAGEQTSVNQLFQIIKDKSGSVLEPTHKDQRIGDIHDSLASIDKAKRLLNFSPNYDINNGIEKTYDWFLENSKVPSN